MNGTIIAGLTNATVGNTPDAFRFPVDILIESDGGIYVTNGGNNRLQFWLSGSSSGITIAGKMNIR